MCLMRLFISTIGGNLGVSLCFKVASYGVRLPDGILTSYAPFNVQFRPSPSRLLTLLDPLLPVGILTQCLAAYIGTTVNSGENAGNKPPAGSNGTVEKAHNSSKDTCCYAEDVLLLPDVVKDSQSGSKQVQHASSEFDLVHSQKENLLTTRSQSDSALPTGSKIEIHQGKLMGVSSFGVLSDDHLTTMTKNPFISPLVASNEQLAKLPPIDLLVS